MSPSLKIFADRLKELMGTLSQEEFSKKIGINRTTLINYLFGKREPQILVLKQIAEECEVSADYLLGLSNCRSLKDDEKTACFTTGLSENTISQLKSNPCAIRFINSMFENGFDEEIFNVDQWAQKAAEFNVREEYWENQIKQHGHSPFEHPKPPEEWYEQEPLRQLKSVAAAAKNMYTRAKEDQEERTKGRRSRQQKESEGNAE